MSKDANHRAHFAHTLQLGKTVMFPLFQEWAKELREMEKAARDSLEREAARGHLQLLLNQTLPNMIEANPVFCGIADDVVNLRVYLSNDVAQPALHVAAKQGDIGLVNHLLERNARFDIKDSGDSTALHVGVDHLSVVKALLRAAEKAEKLTQLVEQRSNARQTALHLCRREESARLLLHISPGLVLARDQNKSTAAHASVNFPEMLDLLLAAIKDERQLTEFVEQANKEGETALHLCKSAKSARLLLRASPRLMFAKDEKGNTALHLGADTAEVVKVLLAAIADEHERKHFVEQVNNERQTALYLCSNAESARLLLSASPGLLFAQDRKDNTALHLRADSADVVKAILEAIEDEQERKDFVEQVNINDETALHLCSDAESARLLLSVAPRLVFATDKYENTALHSQVNDVGVVKVLLAAVQDDEQQLARFVQQGNCRNYTALHYCNNATSARLLLRASPCAVFIKNDNESTALHLQVNEASMVEVLLAAVGDVEQFVQHVDDYGKSALHYCTNAESARLLLHVSPTLFFALDVKQSTALHYCANSPDVVQVILNAAREAGQLVQFVEQADDMGQTALHVCKNLQSARLLLEASSDLTSIKSRDGYTPLHVSAIQGREDICRLLLAEFDVDINAQSKVGQTALHLACLFRRAEIVALLVKHSANVLARDAERRTVLHYLLMDTIYSSVVKSFCPHSMPHGHVHKAELIWDLLLKQGEANVVTELTAACDARGRTALHYWAMLNGNGWDVPEMLMMAGANGNAQDERGDTAIHLVLGQYHIVTVLSLIKRWAFSIRLKNHAGRNALDYVHDANKRAELLRASVLACAVTLRFATRNKPSQVPWKRLPRELFSELCSFLV